MKLFVENILKRIRELGRALSAEELEELVRACNQGIHDNAQHVSKRKALPWLMKLRDESPQAWKALGASDAEEALLLQTLRMKPRRTASGVATITVITKPWACSGACIYCPNDVRMPKSYLHNEPACQRAERNCFDPYLQVCSRLRALANMGHITDKVELIVLGGTWNDYPESYRIWFVRELFRALNDFSAAGAGRSGENTATSDGSQDAKGSSRTEAAASNAPGDAQDGFANHNEEQRRAFYESAGISHDDETLAAACAKAQNDVWQGKMSHAQAVAKLYAANPAWTGVAALQTAMLDDVFAQHARNVNAPHRNVGLVIETRPDSISCEALALMRALGCTKIQMGVQSLNTQVLAANHRGTSPEVIARAFALCRLFGFKSHAHFMANLLGATPESDVVDYRMLVEDTRYLPDEVKMYPCALIDGTELARLWREGAWSAYSENDLVNVLANNVLTTPSFTRISRMIRDFSSGDIITGNKKVNLREVVEARAEELAREQGLSIQEIRHRELAGAAANFNELRLGDFAYETENTTEHFLQWVTPENKIAGFLRLSLPGQDEVRRLAESDEYFPIGPGQAMIREVHVYGKVAALGGAGQNAQHQGLGRALIQRACEIAAEAGFASINVISAVGTRAYYAKQGFEDAGLYQRRSL